MVWPAIAVVAASTAGNLISGYLSGENSKRIAAADRARLQALQNEIRNNWSNPDYTGIPQLSFQDYQLLQKYVPEAAQHIEEGAPQVLTEAKSQTEKSTQMEALNQLRNLGITGEDTISQAAQESAQFRADQAAKAQRENALRELANRGMAGSGLDALSMIQSGQQAEAMGRQAQLQAAQEAQQRRLQAIQGAASLAGQMRQANTNVEKSNVDIMNDFNRRIAEGRQKYAYYLSNLHNEAQQANIAQNQQIANMNTQNANQATQTNWQERIRRAQEVANTNNDKLRTLAGVANSASNRQTDMEMAREKANAEMWSQIFQTGANVGGKMLDNAAKKDK